jgi:hypothetical protein
LLSHLPGGKQGLKVFENIVMKRISGPKREEVAGDWRKLHNKEFYKLYYSPE